MRLALLWLIVTSSTADDDAAAVAKQREAAKAAWAKLNLERLPATAEAEGLFITADLPPARTKALAAALQKQYATAAKALGYSATERPLAGKVAVYVAADAPAYAALVRQLEKRRTETEESAAAVLTGEEPHLIVGPPRAKGQTVETAAARQLVVGLLKFKAGAGVEVPAWLQDGFARATAYRAGQANLAIPAKRANPEWSGKAAKLSPVVAWADEAPPEARKVVGAHLADLLAYGPAHDKFGALLGGFRPDEGGQPRTAAEAFKASGLTEAEVAQAWKKWR